MPPTVQISDRDSPGPSRMDGKTNLKDNDDINELATGSGSGGEPLGKNERPRPGWTKVVPPWTMITFWIAISSSVIVYNQQILTNYEFPYPVTLTSIHLLFQSVATRLLYRYTTLLDPSPSLSLPMPATSDSKIPDRPSNELLTIRYINSDSPPPNLEDEDADLVDGKRRMGIVKGLTKSAVRGAFKRGLKIDSDVYWKKGHSDMLLVFSQFAVEQLGISVPKYRIHPHPQVIFTCSSYTTFFCTRIESTHNQIVPDRFCHLRRSSGGKLR